MSTRNFSIRQTLSYSWSYTQNNLKLLIPALLIAVLAQAGLSRLILIFDQGLLSLLLKIITWTVNLTLSTGLVHISLKLTAGQPANLTNLYSHISLRFLGQYILGSLLYTLVVILGTILFIIPGLILGLGLMFYSFYIIDLKINPFQALKNSWLITKGVKIKLSIFLSIILLINLLGAALIGLGLLISTPFSIISLTYLYRTLNQPTSTT